MATCRICRGRHWTRDHPQEQPAPVAEKVLEVESQEPEAPDDVRSDLGSLAQSLRSGTTHLNSLIAEALGGKHAEEIGRALVPKTLELGYRLLTHASSGHESRQKPYRWMFFRRWSIQEIRRLVNRPDLRRVGDGHDWHVVIQDLADAGRSSKHVTQFFQTNFDIIYDVIRDQLSLLDDDDPQIIETALRNEDFQTVLRCYYESDTLGRDSLILGRLELWEEGALLHMCCEKGFTRCVELLLSKYAQQTAAEPWLVLADPFRREKRFGNSAFHSAAWKGSADVMRVLLQWADEQRVTRQVVALQNAQQQTLCDMVRQRLKFSKPNTAKWQALTETFNVMAPLFGEPPIETGGEEEQDPDAADRARQILLQKDDFSTAAIVEVENPTLRTLVEAMAPNSGILENASGFNLLFLNMEIATTEEDLEHARRFMKIFAKQRRIAFMNCTASPDTVAALIHALSELLRASAESPMDLNAGMKLPTINQVTLEGSPALGAAMEDLHAAMLESCESQVFGFLEGCDYRCLPDTHRHLPTLVSLALQFKGITRSLLSEESNEGRRDMLDKLNRDFKSHNRLLEGPTHLERKFLNKASMLHSASICSCLHPTWKLFVEEFCRSLAVSVATLPRWAELLVGRPLTPEDEEMLMLFRRMADEACLTMLDSRLDLGQPGITKLGPLMVKAFGTHEAAALFPQTTALLRRHRFLK